MIATAPVDTAAARLAALANSNPRMSEVVEYYRCIIPALFAASESILPVSLPAVTIEAKLKSGIPLLVGEEWSIRPQDCHDVFLSISRATRRGLENRRESPHNRPAERVLQLDRIIARIKTGDLNPLMLLSAVDQEGNCFLKETAIRLELDSHILELLAKNTLRAFLFAWRKGLQDAIDLQNWQRSRCPFCGYPPALAEKQGVERARYLRCLQCGSRWPYPNLMCAFCGNHDHHSLGFLQLESDTNKYYVHTCENCRRYIKTVESFDPLPAEMLLPEDLATLHLDRLAIEKGYK